MKEPRPWRLVAALTVVLAGCVSPRVVVDAQESFASASTYSRIYPVLDSEACEAARRTLLGQGYVINLASPEQVRGRKSFQPSAETHVEVELNIVCAREGYKGLRTIAFVNAVQDSFALKKSSNSASLGLPAFGAVSLPFNGSEESMVKVASVTITSASFYDRFFQLLETYLAGDPGQLLPPDAGLGPIAARTPTGFPRAASAAASGPAPAASAAGTRAP